MEIAKRLMWIVAGILFSATGAPAQAQPVASADALFTGVDEVVQQVLNDNQDSDGGRSGGQASEL